MRDSRVTRMARFLRSSSCLRGAVLLVLSAAVSSLSMLALLGQLGYAAREVGAVVGIDDVSVGDALLWLLMGHPVLFEVTWLAPWVLVLASALVDVRCAPVALYVAGGDRAQGWASCCLATARGALTSCGALLLSQAAWLLALGGSRRWSPAR